METDEAPLHVRLLATLPAPQPGCLLLSKLPAEVRRHIYSYVLTDYPGPEPEHSHLIRNCYVRPSYSAPRRTDTELLRSCRFVYAECWSLPFALREQVLWLAGKGRAPPRQKFYCETPEERQELANQLRELAEKYTGPRGCQVGGRTGDAETSENNQVVKEKEEKEKEEKALLEFESLRVFAQMYKLEEGGLGSIFELAEPYLRPRRLTLAIRHTDWWYWEMDEPLRIDGRWIEKVCQHLPSSVREVCVELETVDRKKNQADAIVSMMRSRWFFKRQDGVALFADAGGRTCEVDRWTGSSSWNRRRWTRDETAPGEIQYYTVSVRFLTTHAVGLRGGEVDVEASRGAENDDYDAQRLNLELPLPRKRVSMRPINFNPQRHVMHLPVFASFHANNG